VGIGGSGMSGLAEILLKEGYVVSGSDINRSSVTQHLEQLGAQVFIGHRWENVKGAEVLVISTAIHKHNPEVIEAQNTRIPVIHRSEMLSELMRMKYGIVVAGTHGKTTTTSILASSLHFLGLDPTVVIGGKLNSFGSSAKKGGGDLFVAEADESDGSFLRLTPAVAVLTNIDRDHLDYYNNIEEILKAFEAFIDKVPFYGAVCACIDDPIVQLILPNIRKKLITYGLRQDADITAFGKETQGMRTTYCPVLYEKKYPQVTLQMPGLYNLTNSLATFAVASFLGLNIREICKSISEFSGVQHRFTVLGEIKDTLIIDDYAHNPKKIETVLKGTKESFPERQIIVIFQPHRYSRVKFQMHEFAKCFLHADFLIMTSIYSAGEQNTFDFNKENFLKQIRLNSFYNAPNLTYLADHFSDAANIAFNIIKALNKNKKTIVLTLGAGDVRFAGTLLLEKLNIDFK
jgi:UDP-N-acetylmuramate--alanine ligase